MIPSTKNKSHFLCGLQVTTHSIRLLRIILRDHEPCDPTRPRRFSLTRKRRKNIVMKTRNFGIICRMFSTSSLSATLDFNDQKFIMGIRCRRTECEQEIHPPTTFPFARWNPQIGEVDFVIEQIPPRRSSSHGFSLICSCIVGTSSAPLWTNFRNSEIAFNLASMIVWLRRASISPKCLTIFHILGLETGIIGVDIFEHLPHDSIIMCINYRLHKITCLTHFDFRNFRNSQNNSSHPVLFFRCKSGNQIFKTVNV